MKLGLWMSPLHFNPNSQTYQQHPDWACAPVGRGALLAFRQDDGRSSVSVALRNVPRGLVFDLLEAPTGRTVGRASSEELRQGLRLDIGQTGGAKVLLIVPAR